MIEIEDEDHQRDESSASDCSEMPSLLSHHGLDDSSDDSIDARIISAGSRFHGSVLGNSI